MFVPILRGCVCCYVMTKALLHGDNASQLPYVTSGIILLLEHAREECKPMCFDVKFVRIL